MSKTLCDPAIADPPVDHATWFATRAAEGGFDAVPEGGEAITVRPDGEGWRVVFPGAEAGWTLRRGTEAGERFLLLEADGQTESGRTAALDAPGIDAGAERSVLLGDGRLYRLMLRGPVDSRYELLGWETPGAYLTARISDRGWTMTPEPACSGLREIRSLAILLAAELLDFE